MQLHNSAGQRFLADLTVREYFIYGRLRKYFIYYYYYYFFCVCELLVAACSYGIILLILAVVAVFHPICGSKYVQSTRWYCDTRTCKWFADGNA